MSCRSLFSKDRGGNDDFEVADDELMGPQSPGGATEENMFASTGGSSMFSGSFGSGGAGGGGGREDTAAVGVDGDPRDSLLRTQTAFMASHTHDDKLTRLQALKTGYLIKRPSIQKSRSIAKAVPKILGTAGKRKFFVLRGSSLSYYPDHHTVVGQTDGSLEWEDTGGSSGSKGAQKQPEVEVLLTGNSDVRLFYDPPHATYGLFVKGEDKKGGGRVLQLVAADETDRQEWKDAILMVITQVKFTTRGYLMKRTACLEFMDRDARPQQGEENPGKGTKADPASSLAAFVGPPCSQQEGPLLWQQYFFILSRERITFHTSQSKALMVEGLFMLTKDTTVTKYPHHVLLVSHPPPEELGEEDKENGGDEHHSEEEEEEDEMQVERDDTVSEIVLQARDARDCDRWSCAIEAMVCSLANEPTPSSSSSAAMMPLSDVVVASAGQVPEWERVKGNVKGDLARLDKANEGSRGKENARLPAGARGVVSPLTSPRPGCQRLGDMYLPIGMEGGAAVGDTAGEGVERTSGPTSPRSAAALSAAIWLPVPAGEVRRKEGYLNTRPAIEDVSEIWHPNYFILTDKAMHRFPDHHFLQATSRLRLTPQSAVFETDLQPFSFELVTADKLLHVQGKSYEEALSWLCAIKDAIGESTADTGNLLLREAMRLPDQFYMASFETKRDLGIVLERSQEWTLVKSTDRTQSNVTAGSALAAIDGRSVVLNSYAETINLLKGWQPPLNLLLRRAPEKMGYINKQCLCRNRSAKRWRQFYFVLAEGKLSWFTAESTPMRLQGSVSMRGSATSLTPRNQAGGQLHCFTVESGLTTLLLQGMTSPDMLDWATHIYLGGAIANGGGFLLDVERAREQAYADELAEQQRQELALQKEEEELEALKQQQEAARAAAMALEEQEMVIQQRVRVRVEQEQEQQGEGKQGKPPQQEVDVEEEEEEKARALVMRQEEADRVKRQQMQETEAALLKQQGTLIMQQAALIKLQQEETDRVKQKLEETDRVKQQLEEETDRIKKEQEEADRVKKGAGNGVAVVSAAGIGAAFASAAGTGADVVSAAGNGLVSAAGNGAAVVGAAGTGAALALAAAVTAGGMLATAGKNQQEQDPQQEQQQQSVQSGPVETVVARDTNTATEGPAELSLVDIVEFESSSSSSSSTPLGTLDKSSMMEMKRAGQAAAAAAAGGGGRAGRRLEGGGWNEAMLNASTSAVVNGGKAESDVLDQGARVGASDSARVEGDSVRRRRDDDAATAFVLGLCDTLASVDTVGTYGGDLLDVEEEGESEEGEEEEEVEVVEVVEEVDLAVVVGKAASAADKYPSSSLPAPPAVVMTTEEKPLQQEKDAGDTTTTTNNNNNNNTSMDKKGNTVVELKVEEEDKEKDEAADENERPSALPAAGAALSPSTMAAPPTPLSTRLAGGGESTSFAALDSGVTVVEGGEPSNAHFFADTPREQAARTSTSNVDNSSNSSSNNDASSTPVAAPRDSSPAHKARGFNNKRASDLIRFSSSSSTSSSSDKPQQLGQARQSFSSSWSKLPRGPLTRASLSMSENPSVAELLAKLSVENLTDWQAFEEEQRVARAAKLRLMGLGGSSQGGVGDGKTLDEQLEEMRRRDSAVSRVQVAAARFSNDEWTPTKNLHRMSSFSKFGKAGGSMGIGPIGSRKNSSSSSSSDEMRWRNSAVSRVKAAAARYNSNNEQDEEWTPTKNRMSGLSKFSKEGSIGSNRRSSDEMRWKNAAVARVKSAAAASPSKSEVVSLSKYSRGGSIGSNRRSSTASTVVASGGGGGRVSEGAAPAGDGAGAGAPPRRERKSSIGEIIEEQRQQLMQLLSKADAAAGSLIGSGATAKSFNGNAPVVLGADFVLEEDTDSTDEEGEEDGVGGGDVTVTDEQELAETIPDSTLSLPLSAEEGQEARGGAIHLSDEVLSSAFASLDLSNQTQMINAKQFAALWRALTGEQNLFREMSVFAAFNKSGDGSLTQDEFVAGFRVLEKQQVVLPAIGEVGVGGGGASGEEEANSAAPGGGRAQPYRSILTKLQSWTEAQTVSV